MSDQTANPAEHIPPAPANWFVTFLWHLQDVYHELKPCRFAFLIAVIGAVVFLYVEEGTEVLRALAEPGNLTGATGRFRVGAFAFGLLAWSLVSWYSARVLLYFDFPETQAWHPVRAGFWEWLHSWLRRNGPRILGVAPSWIVGWSFLNARGTYEKQPPGELLWFGLVALAMGILLLLFFIGRRWWILGRRATAGPVTGEKEEVSGLTTRYRSLGQLKKESLIALAVMGTLSVGLSVIYIVNPVYFAGGTGTGAVLMFAAASWVFWGSALVYLGSWYRLPVISFVVVWVAFCSLFNDNHDVAVVSRSAFPRPTLQQAVLDWQSRITAKYSDRPVHPLFIVAAEGGGIRAAYWTATVLGSIQDADPSFADHVFAISGVSGGSVGAAVFDALVADKTPQGEFAQRGQKILGQDFLSPAVAAMLYPDLWQRFLPFPIAFLDRGRWLERGWEKAWQNTTQSNRLASAFLDLWQDHNVYVPALLLNGTSVEAGNRMIVSNLLINQGFLSATDVTGELFTPKEHNQRRNPTKDVRLSTAAHISARFTYVSPAGRFASDGSHVVDGGYFENSGAATALDVLRQVNDILSQQTGQAGGVVRPQIIMISNDPLGIASGSRELTVTKETLKTIPASASDEAAQRKPGTFLEDALAPIYALLSAREARGDYAQRAIGRAQEDFCERNKASPLLAVPETKCMYFFSLAPATVPLPLGWMLSNGAAQAMQQEMKDMGLSAHAPVPTWNQPVLQQVLASLHGGASSTGPPQL